MFEYLDALDKMMCSYTQWGTVLLQSDGPADLKLTFMLKTEQGHDFQQFGGNYIYSSGLLMDVDSLIIPTICVSKLLHLRYAAASWSPIFNWCVLWWGSKNIHLKHTCSIEIGLRIPNFINYSTLHSEHSWEDLCIWSRNRQSCMTPTYLCSICSCNTRICRL